MISQIIILKTREQLKSIIQNVLYYVCTTATILIRDAVKSNRFVLKRTFLGLTQPAPHKIMLNRENFPQENLSKKIKNKFKILINQPVL